MVQPILVVMAAGMGSRYGGMKQIDPVGPKGEIIMDYSLYDAYRAGFRRFVFVIKEENQQAFQELFHGRLPKDCEWHLAFQKMDDIPKNGVIPEGRTKPWGTAHAVYAARHLIDAPFMVINADDYYGSEAYALMVDFLQKSIHANRYVMVSFLLRNTLTENGSVARGICEVEEGELKKVTERTEIYRDGENARYTEDGEHFTALPGNTPVSMNCWGFPQEFLSSIERYLTYFFAEEIQKNPLKAEAYLPSVVTADLQEKRAKVSVLQTEDSWMGVTYRADHETVRRGFADFITQGRYPAPLWTSDGMRGNE